MKSWRCQLAYMTIKKEIKLLIRVNKDDDYPS
ncbi:MAG: hypothetical protein ACI936_002972 [Paraglaciecola sp.]|jgi:hypothetical protein